MSLLESHERDFAALYQDLTRKVNAIPDLNGGTFARLVIP